MDIKQYNDTVPDRTGRFGRARRFNIFAALGKLGDKAAGDATVGSWVVHAPGYRILWAYYQIAVCHLRDAPGIASAVHMLPGSTHIVFVLALNPSFSPTLDTMNHYLTPTNFAGEFIAENDITACEKIEESVMEILNGKPSPDTDFIREWVKRYSDSNLKHR